MGLQGLAVRQQAVVHPIEMVQIQIRVIIIKQLPKTTALGKPTVSRLCCYSALSRPEKARLPLS